MTLSPVDDRRVKGIEGPEYELNDFCPAPGCPKTEGLERHHMFRKSAVGGDKWWVELSDGRVLPNCVRLCNTHHREITDNLSKITFENGRFCWTDLFNSTRPLDWQPPINPDQESKTSKKNHVHIEKDTCPTCLRPIPKPKDDKSEAPKVRKTFSVAVPQERWEDGAEVISTLIEESRKELAKAGLPYGDEKAVKYHILCTVLSMFVLHAGELLNDG